MATKSKPKSTKRRARGRVLPDDACPTCATMMVRKCSTLSTNVHGERIPVPSVPHLKCPACGETMFELADAQRQTDQAFALYRVKYNLLSGDEVRAIRDKHGIDEPELAVLLKVTARDVFRWEAGRAAQSVAMDILLRLIRDVPGSFDYLKKRAA